MGWACRSDVAAAVGASSSQGFHRGLLAVLAAVLIGSFEPAASGDVLLRSAAMLAGCAYGFLVTVTAAGRIEIRNVAVHPSTALSYGMLLAVLTLVAWFAARIAGFPHGWWLPLAVAAIGEPHVTGSAERAVSRTAIALCATVPLLALIDSVGHRLARGVVVLFASHQPSYPDGMRYLRETLLAGAVVFTFSVLSKWVLWTLRPDTGRVAA